MFQLQYFCVYFVVIKYVCLVYIACCNNTQIIVILLSTVLLFFFIVNLHLRRRRRLCPDFFSGGESISGGSASVGSLRRHQQAGGRFGSSRSCYRIFGASIRVRRMFRIDKAAVPLVFFCWIFGNRRAEQGQKFLPELFGPEISTMRNLGKPPTRRSAAALLMHSTFIFFPGIAQLLQWNLV